MGSNVMLPLLCLSLLCAAVGIGIRYRHKQHPVQRLPLPPSPPADPIIGHVRHIPTEYPWITFADWGKRFGGLVYARVLYKPIIIINDLSIARELMEKRGSIYSDRPRLVLFCEMMGWEKILAFLPYGDQFRRQRRMMQQHFNAQAVTRFRPLQRAELYIMLENLVKSPENYSHHLARATAGTLTVATYGYRVLSDYDPYVTLIEKAASLTIERGAPGGSLVDFVPALRHIPAWVPGAGFKRHALKTKKLVEETLDIPYSFVKQNRLIGTALPSFTSYLLDERGEMVDSQYEEDVKNTAGVIYGAGFETTKATLHTFIFAMLQYPEVAKRAQADIDQIIGPNRLPSLEDRDSLPYIECILKECLRWCPPLPLGLPHSLMESDVYRGMYLPAKSMVIANIWQFMHDERYYPSPEIFNPRRFLHKVDNGLSESDYDPLNVIFGFGRRVCPGRFFAEQGLWLSMASILAAFDIKPPFDDSGCEYLPKVAFTTGTGSQPMEFQCRIVPRSDSYVKLIQQENALESDR